MTLEKTEKRGRPLKSIVLPEKEFTINSLIESNSFLCKGALQYKINELVFQEKVVIVGKIGSRGRPLKVYRVKQ
jgi:hypothetical protein